MHALSKTLFFTTGSVGLLLLVFIWAALKYGLFKLNHFIGAVLSYQFAGFYLTDFLPASPNLDPGQKIYLLKVVITGCIGFGSLYLILLSYLPKISWQLRSLSFVTSLSLFAILTLFWINLINGSEVIKTSEKSAIFGFTTITYLAGVFTLWYAMRIKPPRRLKISQQNEQKPAVNKPPLKTQEKAENQDAEDSSSESQQSDTPTDAQENASPENVADATEGEVEEPDQEELESKTSQVEVDEPVDLVSGEDNENEPEDVENDDDALGEAVSNSEDRENDTKEASIEESIEGVSSEEVLANNENDHSAEDEKNLEEPKIA